MNFFEASPTRVVGHRGSPTKALENTFESFDRAEADGADAFELDVRLTLDGEAVVHHDADDRPRRPAGPARDPHDSRAQGDSDRARRAPGVRPDAARRLPEVRLVGTLSRRAEARPFAAAFPPRVPGRGAPRAARAPRKGRRSLLLARRAPPHPRDRAGGRDVPQLRRHRAPARRAALARSSEGLRRDRPERGARLGRAL